MEPALTGRCFCGELRYELRGPLGLVANCHCAFCRRIHGAAFTTISMVEAAAFHWTSGEPTTYTTPLGNRRSFCGTCASPTCNFAPGGDFASLVLGSLDTTFQQPAWFHVNTESKLAWIDLGKLPAFQGWPSPVEILELSRPHPKAWLPSMVTEA